MAEVACPPSPLVFEAVELATPVPAIVEIIPEVETFLILWPESSPTNRFPVESFQIPSGVLVLAEVACPPSPVPAATPVPAMVEIPKITVPSIFAMKKTHNRAKVV